jgi:uroporphyrinogen decarboxylase
LILSRECFRRFFAPRYRRLIEPVKAAGAKAFFHSCGQMGELLEDLAEIGFDAVWLQAPLFDARDLAQRLRGLGMAAAIHPDRSHLMTTGSPEQVRRTVLDLAEAFDVGDGGSWFYVEIDNGFRFDNVRALIETIGELRGQR